jgi:hypothetical protein
MTTVVEDIKKNGPDVYKPTCACAYVDMALTKAASTKLPKILPQSDFRFCQSLHYSNGSGKQFTCFLHG